MDGKQRGPAEVLHAAEEHRLDGLQPGTQRQEALGLGPSLQVDGAGGAAGLLPSEPKGGDGVARRRAHEDRQAGGVGLLPRVPGVAQEGLLVSLQPRVGVQRGGGAGKALAPSESGEGYLRLHALDRSVDACRGPDDSGLLQPRQQGRVEPAHAVRSRRRRVQGRAPGRPAQHWPRGAPGLADFPGALQQHVSGVVPRLRCGARGPSERPPRQRGRLDGLVQRRGQGHLGLRELPPGGLDRHWGAEVSDARRCGYKCRSTSGHGVGSQPGTRACKLRSWLGDG
mmetsp:Transcript_12009/g.27238  ORF Transcript_12009/g.27238 Transcript_12009/m.27238 type:complete len:283 (+) Transcript_12009:965-1813(+)